jgi:hypothetical protein
VADDPEEQAEDDAEEDRGGEGKGDGPASASPGEVAGEAPEGEMEAGEGEHDQTGDYEQSAEKDESSTEVGHTWGYEAGARMAVASRRRSVGWQGLVRMPRGRLSWVDCSRTPARLE